MDKLEDGVAFTTTLSDTLGFHKRWTDLGLQLLFDYFGIQQQKEYVANCHL